MPAAPPFMVQVRLCAIRWQKVGRIRRRLEYTISHMENRNRAPSETNNPRRSPRNATVMLALAVFVAAASTLSAATITYQVEDATLTGGGQLTGDFTYDTNAMTIADISLALTAGTGDDNMGGACVVTSGDQYSMGLTCDVTQLILINFDMTLGGASDAIDLGVDNTTNVHFNGVVDNVTAPEPAPGLTVLLGVAVLC